MALIYWMTADGPIIPDQQADETLLEIPGVTQTQPQEEEPSRNLLLPQEAIEAASRPSAPVIPLEQIEQKRTEQWQKVASRGIASLVSVEVIRELQSGETQPSSIGVNSTHWQSLGYAGVGSGLVLDDGHSILTSFDLISGAQTIYVRDVAGGVQLAYPVAADLLTRLAVLHVDKKMPGEVRWGSAMGTQLAEDVMILFMKPDSGPRYQIDTVTGIAYQRTPAFPGMVKSLISLEGESSWNQSAAPVLNRNGEVVAFLNAMGSAIMSEQIAFVADSLIRHREMRRAWLGIEFQRLTPDLAKLFAKETDSGFLVTKVDPESPASSLNLQAGDIITSVQGQKILSEGLMQAILTEVSPGSALRLVWQRDGQTFEDSLTLSLHPESFSTSVAWPEEVTSAELPLSLIDQFSIEPNDAGRLTISKLEMKGLYASGPVPMGSELVSVNRVPVESVEALDELRPTLSESSQILIELIGNGVNQFVVIERIEKPL